MIVDVLHYRIYQLRGAFEHVALQPLLIEVAEEPFDDVQPRATRRDEMQVESWVPLELPLDLIVLVCGVVVDDDV